MRFLPTKLGATLMIWIAATLLVIFGIFMTLVIRTETRQTVDWTRGTAVIITKTVEKSMEQAMNEGDMKTIQTIAEDMVRASSVVSLRVINDKRTIAQSSDPREVGSTSQDRLVEEALRSAQMKWELRPERGGILRVVQPLANSGRCVECHTKTPTGEVLGLLDLSLSVKDKMESISRTKRLATWAGFIMVVLVSATLFILLHRMVLRHIASLSHAAALMAQGNTNITVDIKTEDEIGLLGQAFNRMAVNVNDANERNTSLIRGISDPLLTVDGDLKVTFMNEPLEALTGYRAEEAVGILTCRELLRCDTCRDDCNLQRIIKGSSAGGSEKMNLTTRSGKIIPVISSESALKNSRGTVIGAIAIIRDVSREREAEQKLADEVSWSQSVIKAIADPMFTVDRDKNITFINEAALDLSGYTRTEALGQKCHRVFKGDICRRDCLYDRSLQQGESVHGVERNLIPKRGGEILARASGSVLLTADNTAVGCLEILRDVTEEQRHVANLLDVLKHVQTASETVNTMAQEILRNSDEQKMSVSEQSSSVKEVATTIEELDITSQQTAEKAEGVVQTAQKTVQISQEGSRAVEQNVEVMNRIRDRVESIAEQILDLSQQAQQIGSIVTAVNDLAEQTNLLALNAAIEAARAGEHGRGFTVVAMEVKKLAEQSQAATAKIGSLITQIQQASRTCVQVTEDGARGVEEGVKLTGTAGEIIQKVMGNISDTADAVQQIATIAKQQSVGIQQVSIAMANINAGMNQTTQSAGRLSQAAENFNRLAGELNALVRKYKL